MTREIVFVVTQESDGGYSAKAVGESIFTQGDTWEELRAMVRDAVQCHFGEADAPRPFAFTFSMKKSSPPRETAA